MRIAFLCKRRYMGKDVVLDRYARLYEIPYQLALLGHEVHCYCLDYHSNDNPGNQISPWIHEASPGTLKWSSESLFEPGFTHFVTYPWRILRQLRELCPDVLIGASDIPHVALTGWLAKHMHLPYAVDLYDNFEGFGQARIPGFVSALRWATRNAALVLTTSGPLRKMVLEDYGAKGTVISMPSSVDLTIFSPGEKSAARGRLGLPIDAILIGTAGGLYLDKGVEPLYRAWSELADRYPYAHLVLAGPYKSDLPPPQGERVHYLGQLGHAQVADLFRALDVGVISIMDTPFGRYCFPQKAYEMLACGLKVVVTDIGEMSDLFSETPQIRFPAGDASGMLNALEIQMKTPVSSEISIRDWRALVQEIEPYLVKISKNRS